MSASSWSGWYRITPRLASRPLYGVLHGEPAYSTGTESTSIKTRILSKEYSRTFSEFCFPFLLRNGSGPRIGRALIFFSSSIRQKKVKWNCTSSRLHSDGSTLSISIVITTCFRKMVVIPQPLSWDTAFVLNFNSDAACDHVLIINAEGRAFLRPEEVLRQVQEELAGDQALSLVLNPQRFP